jgi:hypothetical protein
LIVEKKSMNASKSEKPMKEHWTIEKPATEPQVLISSGESILDRLHDMAHEIEEHIRQTLSADPAKGQNNDNPVDPTAAMGG